MSDLIPVYILAGGRSSRFGSDKARALLWDKPLITHVAESVSPFASQVSVVAGSEHEYADLGLRTICDLEPGKGPVAGLITAMRDCDQPWLLITSCDFVGINPAWIDALLGHRSFQEVALAYRGDRWQPMLSLWRTGAIEAAERALMAGRGSMRALLDELAALDLPLPEDWPLRPGVNTPEDLQRFF